VGKAPDEHRDAAQLDRFANDGVKIAKIAKIANFLC
jgi:hypothetical protein